MLKSLFSFFKRDNEKEVELLPTITTGNYILTDTLSDSEDSLLTAKQARELRDKTGSNFKEGLFEGLRWRAENGYLEYLVYRRGTKIDILIYEYCTGVGKSELEGLGYTVDVEGTRVTISW